MEIIKEKQPTKRQQLQEEFKNLITLKKILAQKQADEIIKEDSELLKFLDDSLFGKQLNFSNYLLTKYLKPNTNLALFAPTYQTFITFDDLVNVDSTMYDYTLREYYWSRNIEFKERYDELKEDYLLDLKYEYKNKKAESKQPMDEAIKERWRDETNSFMPDFVKYNIEDITYDYLKNEIGAELPDNVDECKKLIFVKYTGYKVAKYKDVKNELDKYIKQINEVIVNFMDEFNKINELDEKQINQWIKQLNIK